MKQNMLFDEMDSLSFQIQFSVLSGFQSLLRAFSLDEIVKQMGSELAHGSLRAADLNRRIARLLNMENVREYDESIAAYLYCLAQSEQATALEASQRVLKAGGLFWSVQLAQRIQREAQTQAA